MQDTRAANANANGTKVVVPLGINMQRSGKNNGINEVPKCSKKKNGFQIAFKRITLKIRSPILCKFY